MVAGFVSNKIKPNRCNCGESVAFNTPSVVRHIQDAGFDNVITDATIRNFITTKQIGCVGKSTKFWGRKTSATSAHNSTCSTNTNTDQSKSVWIVYVTYMYPLNINNTRTIKN